MRRLSALLFVAAVVMVACATAPVYYAHRKPWPADTAHVQMTPRDRQGLSLSMTVARQLINLMSRADRAQIEPAACVLDYKIWHETDSTKWVDVYSLTLAEYDSADTMHVYAHRSMCQDSLPGIHGHVYRPEPIWWPSGVDMNTLQYNSAPFALLLYRIGNDTTIGITLYWRKP